MASQEPDVEGLEVYRYGDPKEAPPNYYRILAIVSIFFCPLLGLLAIIMSFVSENRYENGKIKRAKHASRDTKFSAVFGIVLGIIVALFFIFLYEILPYFGED